MARTTGRLAWLFFWAILSAQATAGSPVLADRGPGGRSRSGGQRFCGLLHRAAVQLDREVHRGRATRRARRRAGKPSGVLEHAVRTADRKAIQLDNATATFESFS